MGANIFGKSLDAVGELVNADIRKKKGTQTTTEYVPFDTSIFEVGGRLHINW